jgi:bifunctional ADP-heptose synthase (sugar kinase/adenylyltransferase)
MNLVEQLIDMDRAGPKHIMVVGDGMTDIYIHGQLKDTCQEGCPKFVEKSRVVVPGGAANAARTLENWNAQVSCYSQCIAYKARMMVGNRCVFRVDDDTGQGQTTNAELRRKEVMNALKWARSPDAVLLSDYDKGMLSPEFIREVAGLCDEADIPCVADCKREPEVYDGCIFKCNEDYTYRYSKWWERCYSFVQTFSGKQQPVCRAGGYDPQEVCGNLLPPVECVNHVGAGDCFGAHLALALAYGFSLKEAAAVAHSAGRVYVQHPHNRPPHPKEIAEDMSSAYRSTISTSTP